MSLAFHPVFCSSKLTRNNSNEPPFDRHDWYVARDINGETKEVRYIIDYYSAPGDAEFVLDVRPAMTVTGAAERLLRWGGDVWYRASGAEVREQVKKE